VKRLSLRAPGSLALALATATVAQGCSSAQPAPTGGPARQFGETTFSPNDPMSDADLTGGQSITAHQVQLFLEAEGGALESYKENGELASSIIVTLSEKSGISPVYMLARLQSEQQLVTATTISPHMLLAATGCDLGDPAWSGFYNQVECAATLMAADYAAANKGEVIGGGWQVGHSCAGPCDGLSQDGCDVVPANAATASLYSYTPYVGAASNDGCGAKDEAGVTGLAQIFEQYASSFPGATSGSGSSGSGSSGSGSSLCPGSAMRAKIAATALANVNHTACDSAGESNYETSCCGPGNNGYPEYWCSDFAHWVWQQADVPDTSTLTAGAVTFQGYGLDHGTVSTQPQIGDAVIFGFECNRTAVTPSSTSQCPKKEGGESVAYANHVAIVTYVNPDDGSIETVSGDFGQADPTTPKQCAGYSGEAVDQGQASWAASSTVLLNAPGGKPYSGTPGSSGIGQVLNFYVSPVGAGSCSAAAAPTKPKPTPPKSPSTPPPSSSAPLVGMTPYPDGSGYWIVRDDGTVAGFGSSKTYGKAPSLTSKVVGIASADDGGGYWLATADGGVVTFGDAPFKGSMSGEPLNANIVGIAAAPGVSGYWLVGADGGVFAFGASFWGSTGSKPPKSPVIGIAAPDSGGYWLATASGEVFSFGDAVFEGAHPQKSTSPAIVGIAADPDNSGYWLLQTEGSVFDFGTAFADGSRSGTTSTYVAVTANPSWKGGYWVLASDGAVYSFGGAEYFGGWN
jgi:hypothetical protein